MDFGRIKRVCLRISTPADTLFSVVSVPVFLFVGHGVGQLEISVPVHMSHLPSLEAKQCRNLRLDQIR